MKKTVTLIFSLFFALSIFAQTTIVDGFTWDGLARSYRVYIPSGYTQGDELPLVLNYHGFTSTAEQQEFYSGMNQVADTANFFVVYPEGIATSWNVGWIFDSGADDVGFTNALIDSLHAQYGVNLDRVYSCGMSNGGFFSYRLACELNDRIAKIASVTGSMSPALAPLCMPENPIPVMQIHGTADNVIEYNGSAGVSIPIEDLLEDWRGHNSCSNVSDTIYIEDTDMTDGSTAQLVQHRDCADNTMIAFYKIIDGEHTWPGAATDLLGVTNYDINASVEIWNFFNDQYPVEQIVNTDELTIAQQNVAVIPNPFRNNLMVYSSVENIKTIRIFNALGQTVYYDDQLNTRQVNLDHLSWDKGFYFIQSETENTLETIKVIKAE